MYQDEHFSHHENLLIRLYRTLSQQVNSDSEHGEVGETQSVVSTHGNPRIEQCQPPNAPKATRPQRTRLRNSATSQVASSSNTSHLRPPIPSQSSHTPATAPRLSSSAPVLASRTNPRNSEPHVKRNIRRSRISKTTAPRVDTSFAMPTAPLFMRSFADRKSDRC